MTNDLIADMLTRIKNASAVKHAEVFVQYSGINIKILNILKDENYISNFEEMLTSPSKKQIRVELKYIGIKDKQPTFRILKRVSKPGQRIYCGYRNLSKKLNPLRFGTGFAIMSTSTGVISSKRAEAIKTGGEIICYIK